MNDSDNDVDTHADSQADTRASIGDDAQAGNWALVTRLEEIEEHLEHPSNLSRLPQISRAHWCATSPEDDAGATFDQARKFGIPLIDLRRFESSPKALASIPADVARQLRVMPLWRGDSALAVAVEDAGDVETLAAIDFVSRFRVSLLLATRGAMREAIAHGYDNAEDADVARQLGLDPHAEAWHGSAHEIERLAREQPVVKVIHGVIEQAVYRRASDVHLRPTEQGLELLYRIDDEMVPVRVFLRGLAPALVSRIKVLGAMNLAEHRLPQDGRSSFTLDDGRSIDLRISVLPTVFGESVVVRLLDTEESLKMLDDIGLAEADRKRLDAIMEASHGMFLTTGPTGCGKSTTLYAMLLAMRQQAINILAIEDPVEFHISGVQQMQVNRAAGFTFARALRNFLRHDPDVIMVGEIRDHETAEIAIESALTGHLVLSTLHTNTAASTITRMLDLGVEAYLLRASLLAVMAQRLVRLICPHCRTEEPHNADMRAHLGVEDDEVFFHGAGCAKCNGLGVFRRTAVYELLVVDATVRSLIAPGAEADRIHEAAHAAGMRTITESALELARQGRISLAEVWRVRAD